MKWQEVSPVIVSLLIIITVAVLQRQSKALAAILATMPIITPLSLWIIYSNSHGERQPVIQFTQGLVIGIIPTCCWIITAWLTSRAGLKLVPTLAVSYSVWVIMLAIVLGAKRVIGT